MPNHETNNVVIIGAPDKIRAFVAEGLRDITPEDSPSKTERPEKVIDFKLIIPEPEGIERGGCNGTHAPGVVCWYGWNTVNWGTKWDAYGHTHYDLRFRKPYDSEDVYGRIDLRFETAWSQPAPVFRAIEERWGLKVHAITQDEGGFPDVIFGDPIEAELLSRVVTYEFDAWDREAEDV